jgi:glycosyltransferase involved in cell wall biosynthesis
MTLGGNICIRNGNDLDYCWREAIASLLPVCDEVVVCDGESTDGTQEEIREWMRLEPKIKLCVYPWPNPKGDVDFWVTWLNFARMHVRSDFMLQLDADEVLCESSYPAIEQIRKLAYPQYFSVWCDRLNFWGDIQHTIPPGVCLSHRVIRIAPQTVWMPSDGPHPNGGECVSMARSWKKPITIFHYGFVRKTGAFLKKARALQEYFFNSYDNRLASVEGDPAWMHRVPDVEWINRLLPYNGGHPVVAHGWLRERGLL